MSIATSLLPEFDQEMAGIRRVLERIPAEHFDFKPHPKSFSLGHLASHLATVPAWAVSTLATTELDFALPEVRESMPKPATNPQEALATFDTGVRQAREGLARASDQDLAVVWSGKSEGKTLFAYPRLEVLRTFVLNHAIHHRAQLTVYLRLLDLPVPALYGPSADEGGM
jgi:uncharacterized damage-inducible protein DinB